MLSKIRRFYFQKNQQKMSSTKWRAIFTASVMSPFWEQCYHICIYIYIYIYIYIVPMKFITVKLVEQMTLLINTLRPRQNERHFPDGIFKWIFLNENAWISIQFHWSLFLMFQITIFHHWFRSWSAPSHCLNQWWIAYWRIYASLGLNELRYILETCLPLAGNTLATQSEAM